MRNQGTNVMFMVAGLGLGVMSSVAAYNDHTDAEQLRLRDPSHIEQAMHFVGDQKQIIGHVALNQAPEESPEVTQELLAAEIEMVVAGVALTVGSLSLAALKH